ncbi:transformer-2 protein [Nematocida minor]|uniref:transformer-2 protein n=1 Tax=Nematocida minor TaxID=1912983 RepID=UPI0022207550|nr:transformer-2 protein [Nematocida minor]KAI5190825.1 transformer-2 protein [Nematocida minor]
MNPEETRNSQQTTEGERHERERHPGEREYRQPYSRMRRRPYRPVGRGPMHEDYPPHRAQDERQDAPGGYPMRGYRSYPPSVYGDSRYPPYRRDPRHSYDMYPRRRPDSAYAHAPYYNEHRPRPYYKRRQVPPEQQTPVNILSIFGLGTKTKEEELTQWLSEKLGSDLEFTKTDLILDKYTGYSKGYAFVYFKTVEDATRARELLAGQVFNSSVLRVEYSFTQAGHKKEEAREKTADGNAADRQISE